jgi:hypothetical protein
LISVVVPAPVGPTIATMLPPFTSKLTSFNTGFAASYPNVTFSNRTAPGPGGRSRAPIRSGTVAGAINTSCSRFDDTIAFWYCSLITDTCWSRVSSAVIADASTTKSPAASFPLITSTPAARNSVRCDAVPIARMTGVKFANIRIRFSTRSKNVAQFASYFAISCRSVANAFTTCTPAMFSVMIETFRSSASITAFAAGCTFFPKCRMYHVQTGSGASAKSATHGDLVIKSRMYPPTTSPISSDVSSAVWMNCRTF